MIGGGGLLSLLNREKPLLISCGLYLSYISNLVWFGLDRLLQTKPNVRKLCGCLSSSPGQFLFLDWSNPPDDKKLELWWNSCEEMMMGMMILLMMMLTTLKMPLEYWGVVGSACPC